jgi:CRISPR/Cas system-associated exonuclease Cas4 (RecB family)
MYNDAHPHDEPFFGPEDMVNASELREFLYCERAWFLSRQGLRVSAAARSQRAAGIEFHEARAAAAHEGASPWPVRWAFILAVAGITLLILEAWRGGRWP